MHDVQYQSLPAPAPGVDHAYGDNVHLLSHPWAMSVLARLCSPECHQPEIMRLVQRLYGWMLTEVASRELRCERIEQSTRMRASEPQGIYRGQVIDRRQGVVVVDVARAGMVPSQAVYDGLHDMIDADRLRQDHVIASRRTNSRGEVVGTDVSAAKIGGPVGDAVVLLPDPMAATGSSLDVVIQRYASLPGGPPRKVVAMHLIVTPEYLKRITTAWPDLRIYAVRLDRGLSPPEVLATRPGTHWDQEVGLNSIQYIVPGAGGVGELLNNSWV
ncbi:MAG: uracil phosphoribosyltransferase [Alphaproteobacteria bacterium]|nr:uracil phosphoribosyltransferase [Alphaproteobacteria bacterium]